MFKDKKKHEDSVKVTVKFAYDKDIVAKQYTVKVSVCLSRTPAVTSDCNQPSEDYISYISTDLSVEMMNIQNDRKNGGKYCALNIVPTTIQFFPVNTPGKQGRLHYELNIRSYMSTSCIYLVNSF